MSNLIFDEVIYNNIPKNSFPLSHGRNFSCNMGELVPCLTQECVPGGSYTISTEQMVRMAPMVAPPMSRVKVSVHAFFVPNRILWAGWEDAVAKPLDPLNPMPFYGINAGGVAVGSIMDYLGYPTGTDVLYEYNPFPLAGLNKIYNEYYRDQWLQPEKLDTLIDGNNFAAFSAAGLDFRTQKPYKRAWNKDYFTSCLPEPQAGEPVTLPLGGSAAIRFNNESPVSRMIDVNTGELASDETSIGINGGGLWSDIAMEAINVDNSAQLYADLETATATTVNDLRVAITLQQWFEMNQRSGERYIESLKAHFGVQSRDARLQRPEYIGGSISNMSFSEVLQMSSSDAETPQGNMAGHGIGVGNSNSRRYYAEEHGFIISIFSIQPISSYNNPMPKWSFNRPYLEYLDPLFAQLGEEPVYQAEVDGHWGDIGTVFGYQSKYAHYKSAFDTVHGDFKENLDFWHLSRKFKAAPVLNGEFIECNPDDRIFAVTDDETDKIYVMMYHNIKAVLPLPRYNIPSGFK